MKIIAAAPAERLRTPDLEEALSAVRISGARAASFAVEPFAGPAVAPGADTAASARPTGVVMVWIPRPLPRGALAVAADLGWSDAVAVEEHVVSDSGRPGGVARIGYVTRRDGITRDEFTHHWTRVHGPLVLAHDPLFERYVVNVVAGTSPVDGIVEQHFADRATWAEHDRRILEERPAIAADIPAFLGSMHQLEARPLATAPGGIAA